MISLCSKGINRLTDTVLSEMIGCLTIQKGASAAFDAVLKGASFNRVATSRASPTSRAVHYQPEAQELVSCVRSFREDVTRALYQHAAGKGWNPLWSLKEEVTQLTKRFSEQLGGHASEFLPRLIRNQLEGEVRQLQLICGSSRREFSLFGAPTLVSFFISVGETLSQYRVTPIRSSETPTGGILNQALYNECLEQLSNLRLQSKSKLEGGRNDGQIIEPLEVARMALMKVLRRLVKALQPTSPHNGSLTQTLKKCRAQQVTFAARTDALLDTVKNTADAYLATPNKETLGALAERLKQTKGALISQNDPFKNPLSGSLTTALSIVDTFRMFAVSYTANSYAENPLVQSMVSRFMNILESDNRWTKALTLHSSLCPVRGSGTQEAPKEAEPWLDVRYSVQAEAYFHTSSAHRLRQFTNFAFYRSGLSTLSKYDRCLEKAEEKCARRDTVLDLKATRPTLRQYGVEFGAPPTEKILTDIEELQTSVLVKQDGSDRQCGLYDIIPLEEIRERFFKHGAVGNCIMTGDTLTGICLMCPTEAQFPPLGHDLKRILINSGEYEDVASGKSPVVLIDLAAQVQKVLDFYREAGKTPHHIMHEQISALASGYFSDASTVTCMAICRIRPIENAALQRFIEDGWKRVPNAEYEAEGITYAVLTYDFTP